MQSLFVAKTYCLNLKLEHRNTISEDWIFSHKIVDQIPKCFMMIFPQRYIGMYDKIYFLVSIKAGFLIEILPVSAKRGGT